MKVTIVHNQLPLNRHGLPVERHPEAMHENSQGEPCGAFFDFCAKCFAVSAYQYDREGPAIRATLDEIWRENNTVDGSEVERPELANHRSLSVGDVVVMHEGASAHAFKVENFGFTQVDMGDVLVAIGRGHRAVEEGWRL